MKQAHNDARVEFAQLERQVQPGEQLARALRIIDKLKLASSLQRICEHHGVFRRDEFGAPRAIEQAVDVSQCEHAACLLDRTPQKIRELPRQLREHVRA